MGRTSYSDSMYYIDLLKKEKRNFFDQSLVSGVGIDSYNLDFKNNNLIFQNKKDDSLWGLDTQVLLKL